MKPLCRLYEASINAVWDMTQCIFNYTYHTVLPEALEKWTVTLIEKVHYELKASHICNLRPHTLVA
jgi:starch phosphorylase